MEPPKLSLRSLTERYPPRRRYLIGVSGGLDSTALLHLLVEAGYRNLVVCHLNHRLRGRASAGDARFAASLAKQLGLSFKGASADVRALAKRQKLSLETAGRQARHAFFADCAREFRCPRIFLAHHADDQVETVVMNLFRGAGLRGLAGMREECPLPARGNRKVSAIRPLLGVRRAELQSFAESERLRWREDASNASPEFLRNRLRSEILPLLSEVFQRDVGTSILRLACLAEADIEYFDAAVEMLLPAENEGLDANVFAGLPPALRLRLARTWLRKNGIPDVGFREAEIVQTMGIARKNGAVANLPGGFRLRRSRDLLEIMAF
ncbi:MAG: tRNA lysidine(34) synthetase TilS [Verrucomicrobiales bacterium]